MPGTQEKKQHVNPKFMVAWLKQNTLESRRCGEAPGVSETSDNSKETKNVLSFGN